MGKNSLKRRNKTHCSHCQRKLGLGVTHKRGNYFCGRRCAEGYAAHLRTGVELVRMGRKPHLS